MRTKHYLTALVLPLAFAACTNEEDFSSNPGLQGGTLTVAVERGAFGADTKATWVDANEGAGFKWTNNSGESQDKIGMALINPSDASKVLTNYEMSLIGWSNGSGKGEESSYNGDNGVKYTTTYATAEADENAGNGVFQATGLTVMDGNYIVYHPYDPNFAKAGYMAVDFKTKQTAESTTASTATTTAKAAENMLAAAGNNAFSYSLPTTIEKGGKVASTFATKNLSALLKISLTKFTGKKLKKVILLEDAANFDKNSKGFLKRAYLNAEKIKTQSGAAVLETPTYSSMITLAFTDKTSQTPAPGLNLSTAGEANIYMVAGPRTAKTQYSILLIDNENKASIWKSNVALTAGNKSTIKIENNASHPFETYIVTEGKDLKEILESSSANGNGTNYDDKTINILGELEVEDLGTVAAKNVTVQAYGENAETSVTFTAENEKVKLSSASGDEKGLNFKVPVKLTAAEGKEISIEDKVKLAEVTNAAANFVVRGTGVEVEKLTNDGVMTVGVTAEFNTTGNVTNNGTIGVNLDGKDESKGGKWKIGQGTTLTNNGTINNSATVNNFGTIDNSNGTYVQKLKGNFIGQNDIDANKRGNYVIEVANNDQFLYANTTTCTTIRVVGGTIAATTDEGQNVKNILKNLDIAKNVELTGTSTLNVDNTTFKNVYVINDETKATINGSAKADLIQVNARSSGKATAPKLTIKANSIIKAKAIVNNGEGSIEKGSTGIPADVKTLSSTGNGTWDNYPQVVASL